jgi:D-alanyl-D-alanine dipeptidase
VEKSLKEVQSRKEFIEMRSSSKLTVDLRYATKNNFMRKNVYGVFNKAYLHENAALKLSQAIAYLNQSKPGYKLIIFDALRPRSAQYKLWEHVVGTEQEKYVANPVSGSMHNYGFALDLSVLDEQGLELDMGTVFDAFTELSQPQLETQFLKQGLISQKHVDNRLILREAMTQAGFIQLPHEWWHFDALPKSDVKKLYKIVE